MIDRLTTVLDPYRCDRRRRLPRDEAAQVIATKLPIRRLVGPGDVAALAVHIPCNGALTGATYDIDGGQQIIAG
ncbi:hypothetical protein ACFRMN_24225 [Streptomyces sp. NPDC056835]|uniref:hypothetical protein n=1 Tax=Streptomyces sp. NPDC056835 TaxID=3345956 RepID=UPI00367F0B3E